MKEIKVGEYVRTIDGNIGKIEQINKEPTDDNVIYAVTDNWVGMYEEIVKHSENIIDLIEEGDFINNRCIEEIDYYDDHIDVAFVEDMDWYSFDDELLKGNTIVTKEMFNQVKYEV